MKYLSKFQTGIFLLGDSSGIEENLTDTENFKIAHRPHIQKSTNSKLSFSVLFFGYLKKKKMKGGAGKIVEDRVIDLHVWQTDLCSMPCIPHDP